MDDATIERVNLESKLENLQEELQLEKQAHAIVSCNVYLQYYLLYHVPSRFYCTQAACRSPNVTIKSREFK